VAPPRLLAEHASLFPSSGHALELACGQGGASVWLARRGLDVWGLDVSSVAIERARELAGRGDVGHRCRFDVVDLDAGLPPGPAADLVLCHLFRDVRLDVPIVQRLAPGGFLAIAVLSEVGAEPGPFRAQPGELVAAFGGLDVVAAGEGAGHAWLLARAPARPDDV
jgi:SAM-dependent methyltransferase